MTRQGKNAMNGERNDSLRTLQLIATLLMLCGMALPVVAQSSASYKISDSVFNAGGHPEDGTMMTSGSYRVSLDAIGDAVVGPRMSSASYGMDGGMVSCYPPPGEVTGLRFVTPQTLAWDAERSVGVYNLYRALVSSLSGLGYGSCEQLDITGPATGDADAPPAGDGYFYLVTAENMLGEEGTKGRDSAGAERANASPCP
jgi:hypothetical protein